MILKFVHPERNRTLNIMEDRLKRNQLKLRALSIYQIFGGIVGLGFLLFLIIQIQISNSLLILILFFAAALFSYSIFCGIILLKNFKRGLTHSFINQVLQLLNFSIGGFAFQYVSGLFLSVGVDLSESFYLKLNLGISTWNLGINTEDSLTIINVNLVALYLIVFIDRMQTKFQKEELEKQIQSIGEEVK